MVIDSFTFSEKKRPSTEDLKHIQVSKMAILYNETIYKILSHKLWVTTKRCVYKNLNLIFFFYIYIIIDGLLKTYEIGNFVLNNNVK